MSQTIEVQRDNITIRRVVESDREPLTAIAAQIWDGEDYLPQVFDQWMNDSVGAFDVITIEDQVVGVGKLTKFGEGEWWLEGLRIDPQHRGKGLARIMHHYKINQARQLADGVLRFSTGDANHAVHKLAYETGFELVATFARISLPAKHDQAEAHGFSQLTVNDLSKIQRFLDQSDYLQKSQRSYEVSWEFLYLTADRILQFLEQGQVYSFGDTVIDGLLIHHDIEDYDGKEILPIAYADTKNPGEFWRHAQRLAASLGADELMFKPVDEEQYTQPILDLGGTRQDVGPALFSRPLNLTVHSNIEHEEMPALQ